MAISVRLLSRTRRASRSILPAHSKILFSSPAALSSPAAQCIRGFSSPAAAKNPPSSPSRPGVSPPPPLNKDASDALFPASDVDRFRSEGVVILNNASGTDFLRASETFVETARAEVDAAFADAQFKAQKIRGAPLGVGMDYGFEEIVQRAAGRFDMLWRVSGNEKILQHRVVREAVWGFARAVLGEDAAMQFNGALVSMPGAAEQLWHADGEHLFHGEGWGLWR